MCILCKVDDGIFEMAKDGVDGLTIQDCENIQEIILPPLYTLYVKNCPNLRVIHVQISGEITLEDLPQLTTVDLVEQKTPVNKIMVNNCPNFLAPENFLQLHYQENCQLAHEKYWPSAEYIIITKKDQGFMAHVFEEAGVEHILRLAKL
jgi:hypothetical protein